MSYSDYLDGLRDGFSVGFRAGYRKGVEDVASSAFLTGYKSGYDDASAGLPYRPRERLREYRSTLFDSLPLPKNDPIFPKYDPIPKYETLPKYDSLSYCEPKPKFDYGSTWKPSSIDPLYGLGKHKKDPWEY